MSRLKLVGWTAFAVGILGYAAAIGFLIWAGATDMDKTRAVVIGGALAVVGEVGIWVAAGSLGLTIFKRRKALMDRLFRRRPQTPTQV